MTPDRNDRRIVLGMPGYGEQTAGAGRAFWHATRTPDRHVRRRYNKGSLLAMNFNTLWCDALNQAHHGSRVDYFAMIHSDVEPADYWLDTLIDEMEARDLDVLGAAVPIKDRRGVTSIALARPDGDNWRPLCRLTMTEVHRLPETFTSEDVGHPLLLNTGLWVCKFDLAWAKKVHFTINDRIVFDRGSDRYVPECESEDWYFSRLCHEMKLKVGCTRKVPLTHFGGAAFPNDQVWGDPYDKAMVGASVVPDDLDGWVFPDIDGWVRPAEARQLARLAKGQRVLEVGSYLGLSTVCMAQTADHVTAVDPHDGRSTPVPKKTLAGFWANIDRYGLNHKVSAHVATFSASVFAAETDMRFDLVFIDGDHSREAVSGDIARARELLRPDGLIAFHDYGSEQDPGVTAAVDDLISAGGELLSLTDSLAVVRPPALIPLEV